MPMTSSATKAVSLPGTTSRLPMAGVPGLSGPLADGSAEAAHFNGMVFLAPCGSKEARGMRDIVREQPSGPNGIIMPLACCLSVYAEVPLLPQCSLEFTGIQGSTAWSRDAVVVVNSSRRRSSTKRASDLINKYFFKHDFSVPRPLPHRAKQGVHGNMTCHARTGALAFGHGPTL